MKAINGIERRVEERDWLVDALSVLLVLVLVGIGCGVGWAILKVNP